jgi:hypothetical protein
MLVVDAKKIHEAARAQAETKITSNPVKQDQKKDQDFDTYGS